MKFYVFFTALILRPLLTLVFHIFNFVPSIRRRLAFERQNFNDSLTSYNERIDSSGPNDKSVAFFVSSEGEFEQVAPLIEVLIEEFVAIEIVYTSPSVEKKIAHFVTLKKTGLSKPIHAMRLPLVTFFPFPFLVYQAPWFWLKSKTVVFCRYDFFPELLFFKFLNRRLILLSATLKNKNEFGWRKFSLNSFLNFFDLIIPATKKDHERIAKYTNKVTDAFDFRVSRIVARVAKCNETFSSLGLNSFISSLANLQNENSGKSIIFGSLWPTDLPIVFSKDALQFFSENEWSVFIYPHKLNDQSFIDQVSAIIAKSEYKLMFECVESIQQLKGIQHFKKSTIYFINCGGILVESYASFNFAYVGGGFERSIHSVLEPYMAKCFVLTGKNTRRSTEWELINQDQEHAGGLQVNTSDEFAAALILLQEKLRKNSTQAYIGASKNYQSLIQWNKFKIIDMVKKYFLPLT